MSRTTFLNPQRLRWAYVKEKINFLSGRQWAWAIAGGIALAGLGPLLGRMVHLIWPIPMSGSIAVALPRTIILLTLLMRINRFGALTVTGVTEVTTKLALGFNGWWPMSLLVPLLANAAGDLIWWYLRQLPNRKASLILTGASLCGVRALMALSFWLLLPLSISAINTPLAFTMAGIVVINIVAGMAAGWLVGKSVKLKKGRQ